MEQHRLHVAVREINPFAMGARAFALPFVAGVVMDEEIEDSVERDLLGRAKIWVWAIMLLFVFVVIVLFHFASQVFMEPNALCLCCDLPLVVLSQWHACRQWATAPTSHRTPPPLALPV